MNPQESITFFIITQKFLWDKLWQKLINNRGVLALHGSFITDKNLVRSLFIQIHEDSLITKAQLHQQSVAWLHEYSPHMITPLYQPPQIHTWQR